MVATALDLDATWQYHGGDECAKVFRVALAAAPDIAADARVLEIGCAEFNWLETAAASWPEMRLTGIDWRPMDRPDAIRGDVRVHVFPPASFDWIVSISAVEHIGLGRYTDPIDPDGDIVTIQRAWDWLRPGGWLYFDVPWDAGQSYRLRSTKCRIYDESAIHARLMTRPWLEHWSAVLRRVDRCVMTDPPTLGEGGFYYRPAWWRKPA